METLSELLSAKFQANGPERCGVVLASGEVREIENMHPTPTEGFAMPAAAVADPDVVATWHTHPKTTGNLSIKDYKTFLTTEHLKHYIVGTDGIWLYKFIDGILCVDD